MSYISISVKSFGYTNTKTSLAGMWWWLKYFKNFIHYLIKLSSITLLSLNLILIVSGGDVRLYVATGKTSYSNNRLLKRTY